MHRPVSKLAALGLIALVGLAPTAASQEGTETGVGQQVLESRLEEVDESENDTITSEPRYHVVFGALVRIIELTLCYA